MADGPEQLTEPLGPISAEAAELLRRYPIAKPINPNRHLKMRDGRVVEVVGEAAFTAIKGYLDGDDVELVVEKADEELD